jgi:glycosyltransferase involved in cell wall biosynthesis
MSMDHQSALAGESDAAPACCAIIPAYNEAGRVGSVVRLAVESGLFARVLVVDDGSRDDTAVEASTAGADVLRLSPNAGKALAMKHGLEATKEPVVCFLDADLLSVTAGHLRMLVEPVVQGRQLATLGVFQGGRLLTGLAQKIAPMISGQRCLQRALLNSFADWGSGYGIETSLNAYLLTRGIRQQIVYWEGAAQLMKEEKWGLLRGSQKRLRMIYQVLAAWIRSKRR